MIMIGSPIIFGDLIRKGLSKSRSCFQKNIDFSLFNLFLHCFWILRQKKYRKWIGRDRRSFLKLLDCEWILDPFSGQRILMDRDPKKKDRA